MFKRILFFICATGALYSAPKYSPLPVETATSKLSPTSKFIEANKILTTAPMANAAEFAANNNLVSNDVICVRVDMLRGGWDDVTQQRAFYWWEAELKVLDKNGNLRYHVSTVWNDRRYHDGTMDGNNLNVEDDNCRIFYYTSGSNSNTGICAKPKKELIRSASGKGMSIAKFENLRSQYYSSGCYSTPVSITTIEFYPNLSGTLNGVSIREIFMNPENTIVVSRKNSNEHERDYGSNSRIWRAPIITYYRK